MADIELVIKIDEESYEYWKEHKYEYVFAEAVANGTQLPKGHGRLGDLDELAKSSLCKYFGLRSIDIENAPTIIPADKR